MNFALALAALSAVYVHALQDATWLYAVEQPVIEQTEAERDQLAADGLLTVLSRLTGLAAVPRNPEIVAALEQPANYYNRFGFVSRADANGLPQRYLRFTYQIAAVQDLLKRAELPVWWSKRPNVLAWVVLDNQGEREILSHTSNHPLLLGLKNRADKRGLPLTLPLMDLDDNLTVSAADVWGKVGQSLDTAAQRYDADLVLVGRVTVNPNGSLGDETFRGDWEVWLEGEPLVENFRAVTAERAGELAIDLIADRVAEQYAVLPRALRVQRLSVTGLADVKGYADLMAYIESMEFVEQVAVTGLQADAVQVAIASRAEEQQLETLLTAQGRLVRDNLHRGLNPRFIWRK